MNEQPNIYEGIVDNRYIKMSKYLRKGDFLKKQSITLSMIVKNEEKHLEACLDSVKDYIEEIIIVDTGSTDRTIEIAKKYNAKIFSFEWIGDFAAARNFSIQQATKEYILILDADEYLDSDSDLNKVLASQMDHYTVRIKNHLTSGATIFHPAVRLFKNGIGLEYFGKIHEHLNIEEKKVPLTHEFGDVLIHHVGYMDDIYQEKNKHARNLPILLDEVKINPSGYNLYNLGTQYKASHQYEDALEAYKKAFALSKERLYIKSLLYNMIDCLRKLDRHGEALEVLEGAIESFPNHTDFHFIKGVIYEELSYYRDAEQAFFTCIRLGEVDLLQTLEGVGSFLAYTLLGEIYIKKGDLEKAFDMSLKALQSNKYHMPALKMYLDILMKLRIPTKEILAHIEQVFPLNSFKDLKQLIIVLVVNKSSLLAFYLEKYKLKMDPSVHGIAHIYSKQYFNARDVFTKNAIEKGETFDVALLAFLLKDKNLLSKCKNSLNVNSGEWKLINKIVSRDAVVIKKVSELCMNLLIFIVKHSILLNEDDDFNYLCTTILKGDSTGKLKLARVLYENGLADFAQDVSLLIFEDESTNQELLEFLGDVTKKNKLYLEALSFYQRAVELKANYLIYEKVYDVYTHLNDTEGKRLIKREIENNFPLSKWVHNVYTELGWTDEN